MQKLFADPEIIAAMNNPKIMQAMMEMQTGGPAAMEKYARDPEMMAFMAKLQVRHSVLCLCLSLSLSLCLSLCSRFVCVCQRVVCGSLFVSLI